MTLAGKQVLITGAAGGLGAAIAQAFAAQGAQLILHARARSQLAENPLVSAGKAEIIKGDLCDPATLAALITRLEHGVSVLVNNAGIQGFIGPIAKASSAVIAQTLQVNLVVPMELSRVAARHMAQRGYGKIINIAGGGAANARPNMTAYATAKAGLVRFSECLAEELRGQGVDVNCVAPGLLRTNMTAAVLEAGAGKAGQKEIDAVMRVTGEDSRARAAALCVYLASPASDGLSGKFISAVWDAWDQWDRHAITADDYTLRRMVPNDGSAA